MNNFKILYVMGGNGSWLFPLKKYAIGNVEIRSAFKTDNNKQWEINFGNIPLFSKKDKLDLMLEPDIIIGAPDCGHSSVLSYSRKKSLSNPKDNISLTLFCDCINLYRPKIFIMENLPAFLDNYGKEDLIKTFSDYNLDFYIGSVSDFGNSQINRIRLLIMGVKKELKYSKRILKKLSFIKKMNELKTCSELRKGLNYPNPELCHVREDLYKPITLYAGFKLSSDKIKKEWLKRKNKKRWEITDRKFTTAPGVYRNLDNDYPATARKANRQYNEEGEMMTPRELARIMGIPDKFKLYYSEKKSQYWINKARITATKCPPYEVGLWIRNRLKKIQHLL